jgi:hypothetical protein
MAQRRSIASNAPTLPPARIWRRRRASMPRTRWRRPTTTPSLAPTAPCWRAQVVTRRVGLDHRYRGVECWGWQVVVGGDGVPLQKGRGGMEGKKRGLLERTG